MSKDPVTHQPPKDLPAAAMMTSLKSNSLNHTGGYNEITMNDDPGKEGLFLKAQKDQINAVGNDSEMTVGNDQMTHVGKDRIIEVGNDNDESIGNNETIEIGQNQKLTVGVNQDVKVGTNQTTTVGANQTTTVGINRAKTVGSMDTHTVGMAKMTTTGVANNDMVGILRGTQTGVVQADLTGVARADVVGVARLTVVGVADLQFTGVSKIEKTGSNYTLDAGSEIEQSAGTDLTQKAGANLIMEAAAEMGMKAGGKLVIEAPDITLKAGGSFIRIDSGGVTIFGNPVKINCAGAAPGSLTPPPTAAVPPAAGTAGAGGATGGGAGGAAGGSAAGAAAAAVGSKSTLGGLLGQLGVPQEYLDVLDKLLTSPLDISLDDLLKIAPTFEQILAKLPDDMLPPKLKSALANILRVGRGEITGDPAAVKQGLDGITTQAKQEAEALAKQQLKKRTGVDLDGNTPAGADQKPPTENKPAKTNPTGGSSGDGTRDPTKGGAAGTQGGTGGVTTDPAKSGGTGTTGGMPSLTGNTDQTQSSGTVPSLPATVPSSGQEKANEMLQCPTTKPDINSPPPGWKGYDGDPRFFHCGYDGIKETTSPDPSTGRLQNECFYDESGKLVDENHPYAGCRGTPNQYDAVTDPFKHTTQDSGGILQAGPQGLGTSAKKKANDLMKAIGITD